MSASARLWSVLSALHRAGFGDVAALAANALYRDRTFSIDGDGHWLNAQKEAIFASPEPHALRLDYVSSVTADHWLHSYSPKPGDIVFDIGAGIGEEAASLSPQVGHVYAIEAHPDTYRCLAKTVQLSGLRNVTPIHCALADKDGEVAISTGASHLGNTIMSDSGERVRARSLQSLCRELGIKQVDFLKMNIEGAERLAVQGFGDISIRSMAISCHDFIRGEQFRTRQQLESVLRSRGYMIERRHDDPRPWTRETLYASTQSQHC